MWRRRGNFVFQSNFPIIAKIGNISNISNRHGGNESQVIR
jgi:hypothetical protein